jgi:hypothetical protein
LIEELQHRLRDHEKQEVQATSLVQVAARKVLEENSLLRDLLAQKGVSDQEIMNFIHSNQDSADINSRLQNPLRPERKINQQSIILDSLVDNDRTHRNDAKENDSNIHCQNTSWNLNGVGFDHSSILINRTAQSFDNFNATKTSVLEMSCETAASIIAGMRGNDDEELAKIELGCSGEKRCNVNNIRVLQVMGME